MGLFDSIGGFFAGAWHTLTSAASATFDALKTVYNFIVTVFDNVGMAWRWVYDGIGALGESVYQFAQHSAASIAHIVTSTIPQFVSTAVGNAAHTVGNLAKGAAGAVLNEAKSLINAAIHIATAAINKVVGEVKVLTREVASVFNWFEHTAKDAVDMIVHPERLAKVLVSYIVVPLVQFLVGSGEAVVKTLWQWLLGNARTIFTEIEHMLADII